MVDPFEEHAQSGSHESRWLPLFSWYGALKSSKSVEKVVDRDSKP